MESLSEVDVADFEAEVTPARLRALKWVHAAFGLSVVPFGAAIAALYSQGPSSPEGPREGVFLALNWATLANLLLFCVCYHIGTRLFNAQFSRARLSDAIRQESRTEQPTARPAGKCLAIIQRALVLRLACLDAAAAIGFGACLAATVLGAMRLHSIYWLNAVPCVFLPAYVALTFPSADRLRILFLIKIARASRFSWVR
jgi:hypothetical protein